MTTMPERKPAQSRWGSASGSESSSASSCSTCESGDSRVSDTSALSYAQEILRKDGTKVKCRVKIGKDRYDNTVLEQTRWPPTPATDRSKKKALSQGAQVLHGRMRRTHRAAGNLSSNARIGGPKGLPIAPKIAEHMLADMADDKRTHSFSSSINSQMSAESWISEDELIVSGMALASVHTRRVRSTGKEQSSAFSRVASPLEMDIIFGSMKKDPGMTSSVPARIGRISVKHHGREHRDKREHLRKPRIELERERMMMYRSR